MFDENGMWQHSLKKKFLAAVLSTTILALVICCGAMVTFNLHDYRESVTKALSVQAALLARAITPALQFEDSRSANKYLQLLELQTDVLEAAVYNEKGQLFASYQMRSQPQSSLDSLPAADGSRVEGSTLVVYRRVIFDNQILGFVLVRMHYDLWAKTAGNVAIAVFAILMAVLVAFALSLYFQKNVIGPLLSLSELVRKLAKSKNYDLRAEKTSEDEIGYLVDAFNNLLDQVVLSRKSIEATNRELTQEIQERRDAEVALKTSEDRILQLNAELEQRVEERTMQWEFANKELESFSYSVSHDLRSPLRAIDGFSQALVEDYGDQLDEIGKDYLARVRAAAQKMGTLIDDMLKLSRVSRADMNMQKVDLSAMADSILAELLQGSDAEVQVHITSELSAVCDPHLMRIALTNLLSNAVKYSSKKPRPKVEFGMRMSKQGAAFFVQDNGAGFDMIYADKLFGAFQRLHTAQEFPGSGIGLATVKRVMTRHGGQVWAEAVVDKGAIFYFTLPTRDVPDMDPKELEQ